MIGALEGKVAADDPSAMPRDHTEHTPASRTLRGLDWLNFFLADVQTGVGPFLAIYLAGCKWNEQSVGLALTVGGIAGIVAQAPAGALVDRLKAKRALIAVGVFALSVGALLIAFGALPIRGCLYTLTANTALLVAIQILDGIAAAIFGVVSVLVIADLTRGTGRFNLTQGLIATAVGIGASLSQGAAGAIVHHFGYHPGFLFLAAVAGLGLGIFWVFMPETRIQERKRR